MRFVPTPADSPEAVAMLEAYFDERSETFPPELGKYRPARPAASVFEDGVFLVVEIDGIASGCGGIRRLETPPPVVRYEVKHLWLRQDARGSGRGRALLDELERRAVELGATELVLDTNRSLEAAGSLYARSGFLSIPPYNENPNADVYLGKFVGDTPGLGL